MKKLWQMILVSAMVLSCACAVACKKNDNADTSCKHEYVETVVPATCETDGYTEHKCSKCGDTYKDNETEKLGHDLTEWAQQTPATCTEAEVLERHCQRTGCNHQETKDGDPKLGHNVVWTVVKPATCTEDGTEHGACDREGCDYTEGDRVLPKLDHHYVEVPDDPKAKAATCEENGVKVEVCDREGCGDRKVSTILALGHLDDGTKATVIAPTCTEDGKTVRHCSRCDNDYDDDIVPASGHDMELTQTVEVTCLNDGYELWSCKRDGCEYTEKREEEPKLDHAFNDQGKCTNGCDKTINDKLTWVNTKYAVTYNEDKDRLTLDGGAPDTGKDSVQQKVKIPAELFAKMKKEGKSQFVLISYKWDGTTPQFGFNLNPEGATSDWKYGENNYIFYSSDLITITDEMLTDGFEFWTLYCDLTVRDSAWGATVKCTGFDFDIKFVSTFDIDDKATWIAGGFANMSYSAEKGKWVVNDADPGAAEIQRPIIIRAEVFQAMPKAVSVKVIMYNQGDTQRPYFGTRYGKAPNAIEQWNHAHNDVGPLVTEIAITDEMRTNGFMFTAGYADNTQRNPAWGGTLVTGFDMDIQFVKAFDINDKTTWFTSDFDSCTITDAGLFNFTGAGSAIKLSLKKEVVTAMVAEGKTTVSFTFSRLNENEDTAYIVSGYEGISDRQNGEWKHTFTINDDMKANGINLTLNIFSCGWGGTWVAPTGVTLTLAFA